jgi:hypothetical protein
VSGPAIINYLLSNNAGMTALVPADHILTGVLPLPEQMPCVCVQQIDGQQHNTLAMSETPSLVNNRVQVTAFSRDGTATGYAAVKAIIAQAVVACPHTRGAIAGFVVDSILPDSEGQDFYDPATLIYSQTQDFLVTYYR